MGKRSAIAIPIHRDPRWRAAFYQIIAVSFLVWAIYQIADNTAANLEARGIVVGLSWLEKIAPFGINFSPLIPFELGKTTYWEIFFIAIQNTIYVSFFGIIGATLLGFFIGILRLSPNYLVAKIASVYIELFRNIPLLLLFFFWYVAVFLPNLPELRDSININDAIFVNKEGLYLPSLAVDNAVGGFFFTIIVVGTIIGAFYLNRWAKKRQDATGKQFPIFPAVGAVLIIVPFVSFFITGSPMHLEYPTLGRFQLEGGINLNTSLLVCWFALTTYTAAFIAENVRGGILAVSHGQTEAAAALGLRHGKILNLVIIPQAMRVIIPPTISQYLNLTKNSTLAVAIAYEEIASIWMGIALNQTGQALVIIGMSIFVFWSLSFTTSAILNWYNRRVQLSER